MENNKLQLQVHPRGYVESLVMKDDPYQRNWVIGNQYLQKNDFDESDKLLISIIRSGANERIA